VQKTLMGRAFLGRLRSVQRLWVAREGWDAMRRVWRFVMGL